MARRPKRQFVVRFREDREEWEVDYRDRQGHRHRPLFPTEAAALAFANKTADELRQTPAVDDPDISLESYVTRWLARADDNIDQKTLTSYRQLLTLHVLPTLGACRLVDLRWKDVKDLLHAKRAGGYTVMGEDGKKVRRPYSRNTLRLIKAALSTVLSEALDDGYVKVNVALGTGRRKGQKNDAANLQKIRPFSREDRDALLAITSEHRPRYHALYAIMAKAGLRPGEAFGLKVGDLEFRHNTVHVERALSDHGRVKSTKTYETRDVDLSPGLVLTLKRHLALRRQESLQAGTGEPEWLFVREDGSLLDKDHVAGVFRRLLRLANLSDHRVYDNRHTFACILLADGAPLTYVAAQMGHKNPVTTLRWYARWVKGEGRRWVDVLDSPVRTRRIPPGRDLEPESGTSVLGVAEGA